MKSQLAYKITEKIINITKEIIKLINLNHTSYTNHNAYFCSILKQFNNHLRQYYLLCLKFRTKSIRYNPPHSLSSKY